MEFDKSKEENNNNCQSIDLRRATPQVKSVHICGAIVAPVFKFETTARSASASLQCRAAGRAADRRHLTLARIGIRVFHGEYEDCQS